MCIRECHLGQEAARAAVHLAGRPYWGDIITRTAQPSLQLSPALAPQQPALARSFTEHTQNWCQSLWDQDCFAQRWGKASIDSCELLDG